MNYAALLDGSLIAAPATLTVDGRVHYHPGESLYLAAGYLPVIDTPHPGLPEDGQPEPYYESRWEIREGQIVRVWTQAEPPEAAPPEPTLGDRVAALEGEASALYDALNLILEGVTEDAETEDPGIQPQA